AAAVTDVRLCPARVEYAPEAGLEGTLGHAPELRARPARHAPVPAARRRPGVLQGRHTVGSGMRAVTAGGNRTGAKRSPPRDVNVPRRACLATTSGFAVRSGPGTGSELVGAERHLAIGLRQLAAGRGDQLRVDGAVDRILDEPDAAVAE